jgi:hypothetical protein
MRGMKRVTAWVPDDVKEAWQEHCRRQSRTESNLVGLLIARELETAEHKRENADGKLARASR